jgi:osmotically-inducible protein OsmY
MMKQMPRATALALLLSATLLPACAPLLVGGAAVSSVMVATDRRTSGAQLEDQAIELKAVSRVGDVVSLGSITVTSYNRTALVTGQVPDEAARVAVEQAVARIENVRAVVNELAVAGNSSLAQRSSDSIISAKIRATFIDARDLQSNAFKVVTEGGVVYLMGIVTEREASRATDLARAVDGVRKVVRVFEVVSEAELAKLLPPPAPKAAPAAASAPK